MRSDILGITGHCRAGINILHSLVYACIILTLFALPAFAQSGSIGENTIELTKSIGIEIDSLKRQEYHLLPDINSFNSARFIKKGDNKYILEYSYRTPNGLQTKRLNISSDAMYQTREHCALVEKYRAFLTNKDSISNIDYYQYYIALKYASRGQYEVSRRLAEDFVLESPTALSSDIQNDCRTITWLSKSKRALFRPGFLYDKSGRTDVLIFAGYYGVWAGIAIPVWLDAQSSQAYAAGLLLGPTSSLLIASQLTKNADIGRGRASIITLGGHLGTWQGIGWSILADADGQQVVGTGLIAGLAGITTASILTQNVYFSEGHGALTGSALKWGTWFGLVFGAVGGLEGDDLLRSTLLGSDILVVGTAIAAKNVEMSRSRERLISLSGVIGIVAGFGLDLLVQVEDAKQAFGIAGAASVAGLAMGANMTKNYDSGKDLSFNNESNKDNAFNISPNLSIKPDPFNYGKSLTSLGIAINF